MISTATSVVRVRAAATLVPLAVLSAGWTVHLALPAPGVAAVPSLPTGSAAQAPFFDEPLDLPASATRPLTKARALLAAGRGPSPVPAQAVAGYQRAEAVMAAADPGCHLPWTLLAAIGRIESDHGRNGGGSLDANGMVSPALLGPALDGSGGVAAVPDTDEGELDGDLRWDRPVGPLQFLPTTWATVGVDADGDGRRSPQDIDDASVGAAVHLCSGDEDLATGPGMDSAVLRYNHDPAYVEAVVGLHASYAAADARATLAAASAAQLGTGTLVAAGPVRPGPAGAVRPPRAPGPATAGQPGSPAAPSEPAETSASAGTRPEVPAGAAGTPTDDAATAPQVTGCPAPAELGAEPTGTPTADPTTAPTSGPTTEPTPGTTPSPEPSASPQDPATCAPAEQAASGGTPTTGASTAP